MKRIPSVFAGSDGGTMKARNLTLCATMMALLASLALPTLSLAQRPAAALTSSDGAFEFGWYVAVSGNTVAVIGNGTSAYVFAKPTGGWTNMTQTAKLSASDGSGFSSVAVSGNTVVAGSLSGEACVFVEPTGGWTDMTETAKLTSSDSAYFFGASVAVNLLANTIVVGAEESNTIGTATGPGKAYVFVEPAGGWVNSTETASLTASDGVLGDDFGFAVAIQGGVIVAGAPNATIGGNAYQGALYVFVQPVSGWISTTQTAKLSGAYSPYVDVIGQTVSLSHNTIVAGGFGLAYVFVKPVGGWTNTATQTAQLSDSGGRGPCFEAPGCFGNSVSIWNDVAVVGAPGYFSPMVSVADIFVEPAGGWTSETQTLQARSPVDGGHESYGWSVAIDGNAFVVGYPESYGLGSWGNVAYVYPYSMNVISEIARDRP